MLSLLSRIVGRGLGTLGKLAGTVTSQASKLLNRGEDTSSSRPASSSSASSARTPASARSPKKLDDTKPAASSSKTATKARAKAATPKAKAGSSNGTPKGDLQNLLETVDGVGPAKRKTILAAFSTREEIRDASIDQLTDLNGISERLAKAIKNAV